jgi:chemotaxis protein CheD
MAEAAPNEVYLLPGEYFVGGEGLRARTLLGSCVSITLWHPLKKVGAMSHFLLATRPQPGDDLDGRYGDEAVLLMLRELMRRAVAPAECEAKIFGGARMMSESDAGLVGRNNGEMARRLLRELNIPVVSESLYGSGHRNIIFDVSSGNVWSRQVSPMQAQALEQIPARKVA